MDMSRRAGRMTLLALSFVLLSFVACAISASAADTTDATKATTTTAKKTPAKKVTAKKATAKKATAKKTPAKKPAAPVKKEAAVVVPPAAPAAPAPAMAPTEKDISTPDGLAILAEFKDTYVCLESGTTIKEAEESGARCASGAKVEQMVLKMIKTGWTRDEIMESISMVYQGEPVCKRVPNATPCGADGKIQMDFFIMSYCPYGTMLVDNVFPQVKGDMGDALTWTPHYILGKDDKGNFQSLHGEEEVKEDLRQICVREKLGNAKWEVYFKCFSESIFKKRGQADAKDWKFCAAQIGYKEDDLNKCVKDEAPKMADKDIELSNKFNVNASPTTVYNCSRGVVGVYPYERFKDSCVCKLITGEKPQACK
jgi:hypothetical protein